MELTLELKPRSQPRYAFQAQATQLASCMKSSAKSMSMLSFSGLCPTQLLETLPPSTSCKASYLLLSDAATTVLTQQTQPLVN